MDYKRKIIEMVEKIEKPGTLEYLYTYIKLFLDRWGWSGPAVFQLESIQSIISETIFLSRSFSMEYL